MAKQKYKDKPYQIGNKRFSHKYSTASKSYEQAEDETLAAYYRRLAKQANQRMVRLEQMSAEGHKDYNAAFKNVKSYAYAKYEHEALALSQGKSKRFSESLNVASSLNQRQLNARINILKNFLQSPTSTRSDIKHMFMERAETFNKTYGTNFTWESLSKFFENDTYKKLYDRFDSQGAFEVIGAISKDPKKIIENIEDIDAIIQIVGNDEILAEQVQRAVKEIGKELKEFY